METEEVKDTTTSTTAQTFRDKIANLTAKAKIVVRDSAAKAKEVLPYIGIATAGAIIGAAVTHAVDSKRQPNVIEIESVTGDNIAEKILSSLEEGNIVAVAMDKDGISIASTKL